MIVEERDRVNILPRKSIIFPVNKKNCEKVPLPPKRNFFGHLVYVLHIHTGCPRKSEKSNHLVWYKNEVEFLFLAHQLRGNMCPFCLITLIKPLCLLFCSKTSMQKIHRNAKKCHFRLILANWLYQKAYWGPF